MSELESLTSDSNLWSNPQQAQKLTKEKNNLEQNLVNFDSMQQSQTDLEELAELSDSQDDNASLDEIYSQLTELQIQVKRAELEALLSGEVDANDTFLEIHSGSGGTEAQDWAEMLLRMYSRWADAHKYKIEYLEETEGDVAGIKSATIKISGHNA